MHFYVAAPMYVCMPPNACSACADPEELEPLAGVTAELLGIKPGSSAIAANAPNPGAFCPALYFHPLVRISSCALVFFCFLGS